MNIKITGANGYIGSKLRKLLSNENNQIESIERRLLYDAPEKLATQIRNSDVIINLAGAPILQRWTKHNKIVIYNSRVLTTKNICEAINSLPKENQPKTYIGASAISIYQSDFTHNESSNLLSESFPSKVILDWEDASLSLGKHIRRVVFRLGIVLGKDSQTIKNMLPIFKKGLGGTIGTGNQAFPFIHIDDALKSFHDSIYSENYKGIYNLVAPEQITNHKFVKIMASILKKPSFIKVPSFVLKAFWGEASSLLLESPNVIPKRLMQSGFLFKYPTIHDALHEILT